MTAASPRGSLIPRDRIGSRRRWAGSIPYLLLLPALSLVILSLGYPLVRQFVMSFQEFGPAQQFGADAPWVWFDNYATVLADPYVWAVLGRTLVFCFACAAVTMIVGVGFAVLMTRLSTGVRVLLQSVLLIVWAIPVVSTVTVWTWLFDANRGLVNGLLTLLGLPFDGFGWLFEPLTFFIVAGAIVIWMSVPLVVLMTYAALTQVDGEMLEAARLDGAGEFRLFRSIVAPSIAPVLMLVGLLQVIWDLRVFAQISILQGAGGDTRNTHLLGTYVYQLGIGQSSYGAASAVAMLLLVLTLAITAGYLRMLLKNSEEP